MKSLGGKRPTLTSCRKRSFKSALCIAVFCIFLLAVPSQAPGYDPVKEGWALPVYVLSPEGGWDTPEGRSVWYGLIAYRNKMAKTRAGIRGYEFEFVREFDKKCVAVISFLEGRRGNDVIRTYGKLGPVVVSGFGEDLRLYEGKGVLPYAFALDLPRGCIGTALGRYVELYGKGKRFALLADPLDIYMKPAVNGFLRELPDDKVAPFWVQAGTSVDAAFREIKGRQVNGVASFLNSSDTQYLWVECKRSGLALLSSLPLWAISPSLEGIVTADQNWAVEHDPLLRDVALEVFDAVRVKPERPDMTARAFAVASWLGNALKFAKEGSDLKEGMLRAASFSLGSQSLLPDPVTHRTKGRKVTILKLINGSFVPLSDFRLNPDRDLEIGL